MLSLLTNEEAEITDLLSGVTPQSPLPESLSPQQEGLLEKYFTKYVHVLACYQREEATYERACNMNSLDINLFWEFMRVFPNDDEEPSQEGLRGVARLKQSKYFTQDEESTPKTPSGEDIL